jgi:hypothetical protein
MKICKVKLIKKLDGFRCDNIYPVGYNPNKINIVAYDQEPLIEGDNIGYCIGLVADDFNFTEDMVEINKIEAENFIDTRADAEPDVELSIRNKFKSNRKKVIADAGIK